MSSRIPKVIPPVATDVMTRPDLLGHILSLVDEDTIGRFMDRDSFCIARNEMRKNTNPIYTIRTISWAWRSAFDQFARKPINDLTFKLYASKDCTLLRRGEWGYSVSLLDSVTRLEISDEPSEYMDFLSICDPKSFSSVKTVEIKGSIYEAAALSGVPCLMDALTRTRVEDVRIVWKQASYQMITAQLCDNVQLILDRFLAAPWKTTVCGIDKANDVASISRMMPGLMDLEIRLRSVGYKSHEDDMRGTNKGLTKSTKCGVKRLTIDKQVALADCRILKWVCNDRNKHVLLGDTREVRFIGGPDVVYLRTIFMPKVTRVVFDKHFMFYDNPADLYTKILDVCFPGCNEFSIKICDKGSLCKHADILEDGRTYLIPTLRMLAITNRKLRIEVDQKLADYMRLSWRENNAPDYVHPWSQIAYYIVGRDEYEVIALSVGVQCCKHSTGSSVVVGNCNDYRDNLYVVCKSCCEILDDPAKLSGDGVPECASSLRIE